MSELYIDLTDLVVNSIWHGVNTGIQQVQINVASSLIKSGSAHAFSVYDGQIVSLDNLLIRCDRNSEEFVRQVKQKYKSVVKRHDFYRAHPALSLITRGINKARVTCRFSILLTQIKSGDAVFVMGAFWQYPSIIRFYERMPRGVTIIGIIHDLIGVLYPAFKDKKREEIFRRFLQLPLHLIAVSEFTRSELERAVESGMIEAGFKSLQVLPLAHEFLGSERNEIAAPHLYAPYVLYVSSMEPHKNHSTLVRAWKELRGEFGHNLPLLVFAGKRGPYTAQLIKTTSSEEFVKFIEAPNNDELKRLYAGCLFTVFPSLVEGWGLPVGESLWFGKACAASNAASIPEVGGSLCIYFNPNDVNDVKHAVRSLLNPAVRLSLEHKIHDATLRKWSDVSAEIEAAVSQIQSASSRADTQ